jgi:hypothetical protein
MKEKEQIELEHSNREKIMEAENEKLLNKLKIYEALSDKVSDLVRKDPVKVSKQVLFFKGY